MSQPGVHQYVSLSLDSRVLNAVTKVSVSPIPRCDDLLELVGNTKAKCFSALDLKSGYQHVEVDEESKQKAAFVTPDGLYLVKRLGYGLCNAPGFFQKMMSQVLGSLHYSVCLVYIDDIAVACSCPSEMFKALRAIFSRLRTYDLKLNPKKCVFCAKSIPFLGHIITADSIKTAPEKAHQ